MEELHLRSLFSDACRNTANIKNRQPIGTMYVKLRKLWINSTDIIADELNVKESEIRG